MSLLEILDERLKKYKFTDTFRTLEERLRPFIEQRMVDRLSSEWHFYCQDPDNEENPYEIEGSLIDYSSLDAMDKERMQVDYEILMERMVVHYDDWPENEEDFEELAKRRVGL